MILYYSLLQIQKGKIKSQVEKQLIPKIMITEKIKTHNACITKKGKNR